MNKKEQFMKIFRAAEKYYGCNDKRLAGEGWKKDWQYLIATILSAQSRDETTIPIAEKLFEKYPNIKDLANAKEKEVLSIIKSINYNKTKTKNIIGSAKWLVEHGYDKKKTVPDTIEELILMPGVGRKTANLVLTEVHKKDGITVDTHVHRISNVLGIVKTKNPTQTEFELMKIVPRKYWYRVNRLFVLWGKEVPGKDKNKLLEKIGLK